MAATSAPGASSPDPRQREPAEQRRAVTPRQPSAAAANAAAVRSRTADRRRPARRGSPAHAGRVGDAGEERCEPRLELVEVGRRRPPVEHGGDLAALEHRPQRRVDRLQLQVAQRVVERWHAAPAEPLGEPAPLAGAPVGDLAELPEDVALVRLERRADKPWSRISAARAQVLQAGAGVAERHERRRVVGQARGPSARVRRTSRLAPAGRLPSVGRGLADRARRRPANRSW